MSIILTTYIIQSIFNFLQFILKFRFFLFYHLVASAIFSIFLHVSASYFCPIKFLLLKNQQEEKMYFFWRRYRRNKFVFVATNFYWNRSLLKFKNFRFLVISNFSLVICCIFSHSVFYYFIVWWFCFRVNLIFVADHKFRSGFCTILLIQHDKFWRKHPVKILIHQSILFKVLNKCMAAPGRNKFTHNFICLVVCYIKLIQWNKVAVLAKDPL